MTITAKQIKSLRQQTGAGIMAAKKALTEAKGDTAKAFTILRAAGETLAAKKAERAVKQGVVEAYIHTNHKVGCLVVLSCETDFVARNSEFRALARDLAMHITAMDPKFIVPEEVSADFLKEERAVAEKQAAAEKKPAAIQRKIVEGKIAKVKASVALLAQPFIKDEKKTVDALIREKIAKLGENIQVQKFTRFNI